MTILRPKKNRRPVMSPLLCAMICAMIALAAMNVVAYERIVSLDRAANAQRKTLETARAENAGLKKKWYETLGEENMRALVKEYGFVRISKPGYLPS